MLCEQPDCQTVRCGEDPRGEVDMKYQCLEHLAGPSCTCIRGYSGYRISVNEMKECRAVQVLLPKKPSRWKSEPADQDFELEGELF